jgi:hypothetical protein
MTLGTHWIGVRVNTRAGLDAVEISKTLPLPGIELQHFDSPAHGKSYLTENTLHLHNNDKPVNTV